MEQNPVAASAASTVPPREAATAVPAPPSALCVAFELRRVAHVIVSRRALRVGLQLPDELLGDAPAIVAELRRLLPSEAQPRPRLFVLGDTTFGSCCVDEVAAAHASADLIVHFGHACLSGVSVTPALHVFMRRRLAPDRAADIVAKATRFLADASRAAAAGAHPALTRTLLVWDPDLTHLVGPLLRALAADLSGSVLAELCIETEDADIEADPTAPLCFSSPHASLLVPALQRALAPPIAMASALTDAGAATSDAALAVEPTMAVCGFLVPQSLCAAYSSLRSVLYLGSREARCRQLVAHFAGGSADSAVRIAQLDPIAGASASASVDASELTAVTIPCVVDLSGGGSRLMSQRYRMVEAVRGAQTVGLLAGTLGVARHVEVVSALRRLVRASGRASYTFLMGKLNAAKLANFPEVDVFVLVACPESTLLDEATAATFARPVATPHEAFIALAQWAGTMSGGGAADSGACVSPVARQWTGRAIFDFGALLPSQSAVSSSPSAADTSAEGGHVYNDEEDDDDAPTFSLLTGGLVPHGRAQPRRRPVGAERWAEGQPAAASASGSVSDTGAAPLALSHGSGAVAALAADVGSSALAAVSGPGSGAAYLAGRRVWRGLAYEVGAEAALDLVVGEGRRGIAAGYVGEGNGRASVRLLAGGEGKEGVQ